MIANNELKETFRKIIEDTKPTKRGRTPTKYIHYNELKEEIRNARSLGFGYKQISDILKKSGSASTPESIKWFCIKEFNEKPKPRDSRKSELKTKVESSQLPPSPRTKAGFRIHSDDL